MLMLGDSCPRILPIYRPFSKRCLDWMKQYNICKRSHCILNWWANTSKCCLQTTNFWVVLGDLFWTSSSRFMRKILVISSDCVMVTLALWLFVNALFVSVNAWQYDPNKGLSCSGRLVLSLLQVHANGAKCILTGHRAFLAPKSSLQSLSWSPETKSLRFELNGGELPSDHTTLRLSSGNKFWNE